MKRHVYGPRGETGDVDRRTSAGSQGHTEAGLPHQREIALGTSAWTERVAVLQRARGHGEAPDGATDDR